MKKILITFFIIISGLSIHPQQLTRAVPPSGSDSTVENKISEVAKDLKQDKEFINTVMEENRKKLEKIKTLDRKEELLFNRILRKLDRRKTVPVEVKNIVKTEVRQGPSKVVVKEKLVVADSTCVEYDRNFFGVKKCNKWEVKYREVKN